mgnify:CR=1 FL=1
MMLKSSFYENGFWANFLVGGRTYPTSFWCGFIDISMVLGFEMSNMKVILGICRAVSSNVDEDSSLIIVILLL